MPVKQTACKWGYPNVQRFAPSFGGVYATKSSRCRAEGRHILFNKGLAKAIAGSYTVELRQEPEIRLGKVNAQSRAFMAAQGLLQADTS
jgi:hypothetical protein